MTTNYRRGADFERTVAKALTDDGYHVVRSAGSHGAVDILAIKIGQVLYVQAKRDGRCSPAERTELRRLAGLVHAVPVVAYKAKVGIGYRELTGDGPKDWRAWTSDEVGAA